MSSSQPTKRVLEERNVPSMLTDDSMDETSDCDNGKRVRMSSSSNSSEGSKRTRVRGQWTPEEDELLASLVQEFGLKKWALIADRVPGRIGKQCRERWLNHLRKDVKKTPWTNEEDETLVQAQHMIGNKWCEIAKLLPGRPENSVKNRWNSIINKRKRSETDSMPSNGSAVFDLDQIRATVDSGFHPESKLENVPNSIFDNAFFAPANKSAFSQFFQGVDNFNYSANNLRNNGSDSPNASENDTTSCQNVSREDHSMDPRPEGLKALSRLCDMYAFDNAMQKDAASRSSTSSQPTAQQNCEKLRFLATFC